MQCRAAGAENFPAGLLRAAVSPAKKTRRSFRENRAAGGLEENACPGAAGLIAKGKKMCYPVQNGLQEGKCDG